MTKSNQDRKRYPLATSNNLNMVRIATGLFFSVTSFLIASHLTDSPQFRECMEDPTVNNNYCTKKFLG